MSLRASVLVAALCGVLVSGCSAADQAMRSLPPAPEYVALGDSYTSGPHIPTAVGVPGCLRSNRNYASVVARVIGSRGFRDASCSGATTEHMTAPQAVTGGTNPPQLDSLSLTTTVVTLGIGGNDLGFAEVATRCASKLPTGSPCQQLYAATGTDVLVARVSQAVDKLTGVLARIHDRSPLARVFVVGYPAIVPASGPGCWPQLPFTAADVPYLRRTVEHLNRGLAAAATAANLAIGDGPDRPVSFVDLSVPSAGHDACQLPGTRWVEPLVPATPAAALHPNGAGMAALGTFIGEAVLAAT